MCRNIKTLSHFDPPARAEEVQSAAAHYVRKVSGTSSAANAEAVAHATRAVAAVTQELLDSLVFSTQPRDREVEAAKARERSAKRFGPSRVPTG